MLSMQESEAEFEGLDEYNAFLFKVQGDGRNYIANLRTDNWITGGQSHDVWQAALFTECVILSLPTNLLGGDKGDDWEDAGLRQKLHWKKLTYALQRLEHLTHKARHHEGGL